MSGALTPAEIEFIAEKQVVSITPKFTQNSIIYLISVSSINSLILSRYSVISWCIGKTVDYIVIHQ